MSFTQSNLTTPMPYDQHFKPPKTKSEFNRLGYQARLQLQREFPEVYQKFTDTHKPWERR